MVKKSRQKTFYKNDYYFLLGKMPDLSMLNNRFQQLVMKVCLWSVAKLSLNHLPNIPIFEILLQDKISWFVLALNMAKIFNKQQSIKQSIKTV